MDAYTTEQEQVEAIKKWLRENGVAVFGGIAIGLGGLFGWQFWQKQEIAKADAASIDFQVVMAQSEDGNAGAAANAAREVVARHPGSGYSPLAALALARAAAAEGDGEAAAAHLQWILDNAGEPAVKAIARLRLARLQLADGDAGAARASLTAAKLPEDDALVRELAGDIAVAEGNTAKARADYLRALELTQALGADATLLEMKLDDLGPAGDDPAP